MPKQQNSDLVSERRLRPIYDWLDNGNNKKALQEADKVLRKQPDFQCCRALKGLALMRLGKEDEAQSMLDKVLAESTVDEGALQAMTIGYRELKLPNKICAMYEGAVKKEPTNEEFLSHLFMAYVRLGEFKKQQITAMNLYKAKQKNPYYFWSIMSLVLQAIEGDEKLAQTISLPLAHKMVSKMEKDGKMEQEQETMLYLMILELRKDWKGALDVLNGTLGKKLENSASYHLHAINKRVDIEERLKNHTEVARLCRNILLSQPDSWDTLVSYIKAVIAIQDSGAAKPTDDVPYDLKPNRIDRTVEEAESLLDCLGSGYPGLRGPYLAKLEICYRTKDASSRLQELLINYIHVFGTRPVCFSDIKKYLTVIPMDQRNDFILRLREQYPDVLPTSRGEIYREVCITGVERFLGKHRNLSLPAVEKVVEGLLNKYVSVQPLVQGAEPTELLPSDGFVLLASHLLWDTWMTSNNNRYFYMMCSMLRLGLQHSPSNWQLKLLLIRLCGRAGAGGLCQEIHGSLDVKYLMQDTLGWILPRILSSTGQLDQMDRMYCQMTRFYSHSPKETIEYIIQAYKCGNFPQIVDFYNLRRRICNSFAFPLVETDRLLNDVLFKSKTHDQAVDLVGFPEYWNPAPVVVSTNLRDNRDFRTILCYDEVDSERVEELILHSFKGEVEYTKLRQLLLRGVVTSLYLSDNVSKQFNDSGDESEGSLEDILKQVEEQEKVCISTLAASITEHNPQSPYRSRLSSYIPSQQIVVVKGLFNALIAVNSMTLDKEGASNEALKMLEELLQGLETFQKAMDASTAEVEKSPLSERWEHLERNQAFAETVALATLLCGSIHAILRSTKGSKKSKKKSVVPKFASLVPGFNSLLDELEAVAKACLSKHQLSYKRFMCELEADELADQLAGLSVNLPAAAVDLLTAETRSLVRGIKLNYSAQETQMSEILQDKVKSIEILKL